MKEIDELGLITINSKLDFLLIPVIAIAALLITFFILFSNRNWIHSKKDFNGNTHIYLPTIIDKFEFKRVNR